MRMPNSLERSSGRPIEVDGKRRKVPDSPDAFLNECEDRLAKDAGWHPFEDRDFLATYFKAFRSRIRFGGDLDSYSLIADLERVRDRELERRQRERLPLVKVKLPKRNRVSFTDTSEVASGIGRVLKSMLEHTSGSVVRVEWEEWEEREGHLTPHILRITGGGAIRTDNPTPVRWFGGDLGDAVRRLRGFVAWTISADFETDSGKRAFEIDAMSGRVTPIETQEEVVHTITLYQPSRA